MGERKGQNKYYPPDYDPKVGGLNKFKGVHALRERGRKAHLGILIIRFEMPYNIWCDGCNNHIGMGVRYNAEKKKTGMYYTTPVYEFNMKCHLCDNHFIIKTDPGNLDYQIISGARRQENRWDPLQNEQIVPETKETQKKLFDDSMYKLEHGNADASIAESSKPRLVNLFNRNEDTWADNYTANQKLRAAFRSQSKEVKMKAAVDNALLKKSSLNIALLPESEEDRRVASLLRIKPSMDVEKKTDLLRRQIITASALPMDSFTPDKERKAVKALKTTLATNLVVKKSESSHVSKKQKLTNSLVGDYGESSSDSN
ncbi:PREDICTED: coiled-coil domain-containing protein 130 homolog [Nicrophorus vespilloides]|uniref:Coiled-coil domain-containing protein 130 homolog n=1 Tax=Nicrophorus vespilloides TaxID=110193 RepID=A0ABM1N704_NICVS|nr:PREDICTED: coiled-coil domain-containing protein 130 homolog [Nicrophorus vespilloides]